MRRYIEFLLLKFYLKQRRIIKSSFSVQVERYPLSNKKLRNVIVCFSVRSQTVADISGATRLPKRVLHAFTVEECILSAHDGLSLKCPFHADISAVDIAPDTVFLDISRDYLIQPGSVKRGKLIGRGAFGFVFKAAIKVSVIYRK